MSERVYVWDPLVRVFHWLLVIAFATSYLTGEEETMVHIYSGYLIVGLLIVRLIWGVVGTGHARFANFIRPIPEAVAYLKALFSDGEKPVHYEGHNPAGALMVVALIVSLAMTTFSGLKLYGLEGHGPLAVTEQFARINVQQQGAPEQAAGDYDDHEAYEREEHGEYAGYGYGEHGEEHEGDEGEEEGEEFWEEIHEFFVNFTLLLVVLHICGVILSSRKHGENLARAMVTGYKEKTEAN